MARSTPVVPKGPFSIADDSRMSEDYVLSDDVLVDSSSPNPLAAVRMAGGRWTALAVVPGSGLVHVVPDQSSQSGWDLLPVPSGTSAKEVVAVLDGTGTSHAFYQDGTRTYHSSLSQAGTWSASDQLPASASLTVASVPLTNEPVAAGITPEGDLLLVRKDWTSGQWQGSVADMKKALAGAQAVLKMVDHDNWTLAAVADGKLQYFSGRGSTLASGPFTVPIGRPVTRIHFAYQRSGSTMVMFSDDQHALYTSFGFSDQVTVIPNASVVQGAGVIDTTLPPRVHFYGVDPEGRLWVLHQTGWDANEAPVWARILPLDRDVAWVASPQSALEAAMLFAAGADQTLHALSQDRTSKLWKRSLVQQPGHKPYPLTRYRTQLTVTDANGNPAPGVAITIGAAEETAILVGSKTYFVGPGEQTATINTNEAGVLTVSTAATSLVSPSYTVTAPAPGAPKTVRPDQDYHSFLSGTDGVNTGSAVIPPMSKDTLQNATVAGQPLSPDLAGDKADWAATTIKNAMNSVPASSTAIRAAGYAGWSIDVQDPDNPQFQYFKTQDELRAQLVTMLPGPQAGEAGDLGDIGAFFGDLLHAIETAVADVIKAVVDVVDSLISLTIQVADQFIDLAAMVIRSVEDAVPFIHAIFNFIGALVTKVLDWLKDLFGWHDIWNTKLVFEHLASEAIPALQWAIKKRGVVETGTFFTDMKRAVDGEFSEAISHFKSQSFNQIATPPSLSRAPRSTRLAAAGVQTGSGAQNNWLMSKVMDNVGGGSALAPLSTTLPADLVSTLWDALSGSVGDLRTALSALEDFFQTLFADPKDLGTRGVSDLITAAQAVVDFVLDLLDSIVKHILDLVSGALGVADQILTQPLGDIPVVSWLYTNVICPSDQPEEPSILRLACLVLALPITLIYKFANQMKPPFDDATRDKILSWKFTPSATAQPGLTLTAELADESLLPWVRAYLSISQACADMAADGMAVGGEGPLVQVTGWLDLVINTVMQVLYWPSDKGPFDFHWDWAGFTEAERLARGTWIAAWFPILVNLALLVLPTPAEGELAEVVDPMGKAWVTLAGAALFGTGLAGAIKGLNDSPPTANGYTVAGAVLGPLPLLTTYPLLLDDSVEASEGVTMAIKLLIDDLGDIAAGFLAQYG
jgi:hypothetical protein